MKQFKRAGCILLAVALLWGSVPFVVTAAETTGTPENPTPGFSLGTAYDRVSESGANTHGRINTSVKDTEYGFMQTSDDEVFTFRPTYSIQKNPGGAQAIFGSLKLFYGEHYTGTGNVEEYPEIVTNPTEEFVNRYGAAFSWAPSNNNALEREEAQTFPNDGETDNGGVYLDGTIADLAGCRVYTWDNTVTFRGNPASVTGGVETGFYWNLSWTYADNAWIATQTHREIRIGVQLHVTDCRALQNALQEAEATLKTPGTHTVGYLSALRAAVNSVPGDMRNATAYYTQEQVDFYTEALTAANEDYADYSAYNAAYEQVRAISNESGLYTSESFTAFFEAVAAVHSGLSKNLKSGDQAIVDRATAALLSARASLVAKGLFEEGSDGTYNSSQAGKIDLSVSKTTHRFMQTFDNETFTFSENLSVRKYGDKDASFTSLVFDPLSYGVCADTGCTYFGNGENRTADFLSRLVTPTETDAQGNTVLTGWVKNGSTTGDAEFITDGKLNSITLGKGGLFGWGDYYVYSADATLAFTGNGAAAHGEYSTGYVWRADCVYDSVPCHAHITTDITVTDARLLHEKYFALEELLETIASNETVYTDSSLASLRTAMEGLDTKMVFGTAYYTQAEVDAALAVLRAAEQALAPKADYTGYFSALDIAEALLQTENSEGLYPASEFEAFRNTVTAVSGNFNPDLAATEQQTVDSGEAAIRRAVQLLLESEACDYSVLDAAIAFAEGLAAEGGYTAATALPLSEALRTAQGVERNLPKGSGFCHQNRVDALAEELIVKANALQKKADYTAFDAAKKQADAIVLAGNGTAEAPTYPAAAWETFLAAVQTADAVNTDLPLTPENAQLLAEATQAVLDAVSALTGNAYCDYTNLDIAIAAGNAALSGGGKTEASLAVLREAVDAAKKVTRGLTAGDGTNQQVIDAACAAVNAAVLALVTKADYSAYDTLKQRADALTNENGRYDAADYQAFSETAEALDSALNKDLPDSVLNRATIKTASDALKAALATLEAAQYYFVRCFDENGAPLTTVRTRSANLGTLALPAIPADTATAAYCGWKTVEEAVLSANFTVISDISIYLAKEAKVLLPKASAALSIDPVSGVLTGVAGNTSVAQFLSELENDETVVEIRSFAGVLLGSGDPVGTGATVTLRSKYTHNRIYSTSTVLLPGDVNGDGLIDNADCEKANAVSLGLSAYTAAQDCFLKANDVNGDGVIDVFDCTGIAMLSR